MASSANPDLWADLSDLSSADACATLLKVNADMFVAAPARDRESIETFEALALGFLPKADHATLLDIARILAPCPDTPPSLWDYLLRHVTEASDLAQPGTPRTAAKRRVDELATPAGRAALAASPGLGAAMAERLLVLREAATEEALAANPALPASSPACHELVRRAVDRPALAGRLLERGDLTASQEACLYLSAAPERRRWIRERIAQAQPQRAEDSCSLEERDSAAFLAAAAAGEAAYFEHLLTRAFGFPASTEWRVLQIGRHPLLALSLKALGLPRKDATRIVLTLHPALSYPLSAARSLIRETRDVSGSVALLLVEAILGVKALSGDVR